MFDWFRRKRSAPPAPRDLRGLNEDWQVGDLARCVRSGFVPSASDDPVVGDVLRVARIDSGLCRVNNTLISALGFVGKSANVRWDVRSFVKIRPDHSATEIEEGLIARIKSARPAKSPVPNAAAPKVRA